LPAKIDWHGTKFYYQHGKLNRNYGLPTIEYADGGKIWHRDNIRYKYFFPALEWEEGKEKPKQYQLDRLNALKVVNTKGEEEYTRVLFQTSL
jgi:hypothetical protein